MLAFRYRVLGGVGDVVRVFGGMGYRSVQKSFIILPVLNYCFRRNA